MRQPKLARHQQRRVPKLLHDKVNNARKDVCNMGRFQSWSFVGWYGQTSCQHFEDTHESEHPAIHPQRALFFVSQVLFTLTKAQIHNHRVMNLQKKNEVQSSVALSLHAADEFV